MTLQNQVGNAYSSFSMTYSLFLRPAYMRSSADFSVNKDSRTHREWFLKAQATYQNNLYKLDCGTKLRNTWLNKDIIYKTPTPQYIIKSAASGDKSF